MPKPEKTTEREQWVLGAVNMTAYGLPGIDARCKHHLVPRPADDVRYNSRRRVGTQSCGVATALALRAALAGPSVGSTSTAATLSSSSERRIALPTLEE